jgi:acyl dehydratase
MKTPRFHGPIERLRITDYAKALHLRNPIHHDAAAARGKGYRDVVAPPGFIIATTLQPRSTKLGTFGIEEHRALAGEMQFEHHGVVCAGDELSGETVLVERAPKQGKRPMEKFVLQTTFFNQDKQKVLVLTETILQWIK